MRDHSSNETHRYILSEEGQHIHHLHHHYYEEEEEEEPPLLPEEIKKSFRMKLIVALSGMIIFASFAIPLLTLCVVVFDSIKAGNTALVGDVDAMIHLHPSPCIIEKTRLDCFVVKYSRSCFFRVAFNESHLVWKSLITTPAYDIYTVPYNQLKINDTIPCYFNINRTKVAIMEPSSELYDTINMYGILFGVFGGLCCALSLSSWAAMFAKIRR